MKSEPLMPCYPCRNFGQGWRLFAHRVDVEKNNYMIADLLLPQLKRSVTELDLCFDKPKNRGRGGGVPTIQENLASSGNWDDLRKLKMKFPKKQAKLRNTNDDQIFSKERTNTFAKYLETIQ